MTHEAQKIFLNSWLHKGGTKTGLGADQMTDRRQNYLPPSSLLPLWRRKNGRETTKWKADTITNGRTKGKMNVGKRNIPSSYCLNLPTNPVGSLLSSVWRLVNWGSANRSPRWGLILSLSALYSHSFIQQTSVRDCRHRGEEASWCLGHLQVSWDWTPLILLTPVQDVKLISLYPLALQGFADMIMDTLGHVKMHQEIGLKQESPSWIKRMRERKRKMSIWQSMAITINEHSKPGGRTLP